MVMSIVLVCGCGSSITKYITGYTSEATTEELIDREEKTKQNLGLLRSAIEMYYDDTEGKKPKDLEELVPKYIKEIPEEAITGTNRLTDRFDGNGGWFYELYSGKVKLNVLGFDKRANKYNDY